MLTLLDIQKAKENLDGIIHKTSLDLSSTFSDLAGNQVYLKTENLQKTGSFKIRGAYNHIISLDPKAKAKGVITASAGNHAQGVAFGATKAGIPSTIVMPEGAPISKIIATQRYGARVVLSGDLYDDAYRKALEIQKVDGSTFVHAFDNQQVIAGQGTIGLEILDSLPDVDVIMVPVGGGGLISGIALAAKSLKPEIKIIGVEAQGAACLTNSRGKGKIVALEKATTIADGIAVKCLGQLNYQIMEKYVDDVLTVSDGEIASTIMLLLERSKLVAEGAGATALAALIYKKTNFMNKKIAAVISGGNIDMNFISRIIEKGLVKAGRNVKLKAIIADKPGNLHRFLQIIAENKANVISINHDRLKEDVPLDQAMVQVFLETRSSEHVKELINKLDQAGFLTMEDK